MSVDKHHRRLRRNQPVRYAISPPMHQAVIIVNRRAGESGALAHTLSRRLAERLRSRDVRAHSIAIDRDDGNRDGWRQQLDRAVAEGAERVYVLGGDGTVLGVTAALLGRDLPLGIVPLGTANLLARDLGMPLDPHQAIDALMEARERRIDVARVNGEPFLVASMLGLATTLARSREAVRGRGALQMWPRVIGKAFRLLQRYPYRRVTLVTGDQTLTLRTRAMVISNNPVAPEPSLYPRRQRLDSGRLGIYGVREGPLWELPRVVMRLLNGTWPDEPRIFHHEAEHVTVQGPPGRGPGERISVLNDGERRRLHVPLRYELLPAALPVLIPAEKSGREASPMPKIGESERP